MSVPWLNIALAIIGGYLLGSVPTGYIVGRLWGVDVLKKGSGRTGGANVLRTAGLIPSLTTVAGDIAKGFLAVVLARSIIHQEIVTVAAGLGAIVGHNWSIFLRGRGGAGVAATVGALLGIAPLLVPVAGGVGLVVILATRYVSLGSITGAVTLLLAMVGLVFFAQAPIEYLVWGAGAAALILYAHLPNIQRLLQGTERRLGEPA